jgi:hypothetical protein
LVLQLEYVLLVLGHMFDMSVWMVHNRSRS